jgi:hypothetical protein
MGEDECLERGVQIGREEGGEVRVGWASGVHR